MPRILRTRISREDYIAIEDYLYECSLQNAVMTIRLFDEQLSNLAANNLMGRPRPELAPDLRSWNVHRFVDCFSKAEKTVVLKVAKLPPIGISQFPILPPECRNQILCDTPNTVQSSPRSQSAACLGRPHTSFFAPSAHRPVSPIQEIGLPTTPTYMVCWGYRPLQPYSTA